MNEIKANIKELRERIHDKNMLKKSDLEKIESNLENFQTEYEKYKGSLYYQLKNNCGKNIKTVSELNKQIDEHPTVTNYDKNIEKYDAQIKELHDTLKSNIESYKKRIAQIQQLLKTDLNELERSVVRMTLKDERKNMRVVARNKTKETKKYVDDIKTKIKNLKTVRNQKYTKIRNTIKNVIQNEKKNKNKMEKAEALLRKTIKKQNDVLNNQRFKPLIEKHSHEIDMEIKKVVNEKQEKKESHLKMREMRKQEKQIEHTRKVEEKVAEKTRKRQEKTRNRQEKVAERTRKRQEKVDERTRKRQEKLNYSKNKG